MSLKKLFERIGKDINKEGVYDISTSDFKFLRDANPEFLIIGNDKDVNNNNNTFVKYNNMFVKRIDKKLANPTSIYDIDDEIPYNKYRYNYYTSRFDISKPKLDIETEYTDRPAYVVQYMPVRLKYAIKEKILPKIGNCEFQFNIVYTVIETENFDISISIGYMTFEQSVTTASVSYTGESTLQMFNIFNEKFPIKVISEKLVLPKLIKVLKDKNIKINRVYNSIFNSIHRHPGKFSFSSIDTSMDADEPGVLYMTAQAENINIVDSVIYVGNDEISLIDTWYRKAFIKPDKNGKPSGKYIRYKNVTILTNIVGDFDNSDLYIFSPNKFIKFDMVPFDIYNGLNFKFLNNIPFIIDVDKINPRTYAHYRFKSDSKVGNSQHNTYLNRFIKKYNF